MKRNIILTICSALAGLFLVGCASAQTITPIPVPGVNYTTNPITPIGVPGNAYTTNPISPIGISNSPNAWNYDYSWSNMLALVNGKIGKTNGFATNLTICADNADTPALRITNSAMGAMIDGFLVGAVISCELPKFGQPLIVYSVDATGATNYVRFGQRGSILASNLVVGSGGMLYGETVPMTISNALYIGDGSGLTRIPLFDMTPPDYSAQAWSFNPMLMSSNFNISSYPGGNAPDAVAVMAKLKIPADAKVSSVSVFPSDNGNWWDGNSDLSVGLYQHGNRVGYGQFKAGTITWGVPIAVQLLNSPVTLQKGYVDVFVYSALGGQFKLGATAASQNQFSWLTSFPTSDDSPNPIAYGSIPYNKAISYPPPTTELAVTPVNRCVWVMIR